MVRLRVFVYAVLLATFWFDCGSNARRPPLIYQNQFAVRIPSGHEDADEIAKKHGFVNHGKIGSLKEYFLFEHHEIRKRSVEIAKDHHEKLGNESKVLWFQQQHEKKRVKRDFVDPNFQTFSGFSYYTTSPAFEEPFSGHTQNYRGAGIQSAFPDPLFKEQWYLNGGATGGYDMNVGPAWAKGYTGKGIVISILDDGVQANHPDLALNFFREASMDINDNDDDPTPRDNGDNKHGTRCAGEVAAVAFNEYCGIGVAYNASIGGVRMLDGTVNDAVEAKAIGVNPHIVDIYSASWGPEDDGKTVDGPGPLARRAFIFGVNHGRNGKGNIFVWASGNGGRHTDSCNCDGYTNSIFTLSISSATQGGFKPWYLEECSSTLATTYSSGTPGHDKSVATVDMDSKLRPDHICTVEHTGTSASAPLAAGICALALEANPNLTWRDMQYLVLLTSRPEPLEKEKGWAVNGVNRKVSHKFGYGLMDAEAMVNLAEKWINVPDQHICKTQEMNQEREIDPTFGKGLEVTMDVNGCYGSLNEVRYLEHVQCKISLRFFPRGNLKILLTSPMGTTSTLLFERPRDVVGSSFDDWPFLSVHYWGEKAEGTWTLKIINSGNRHVNQPGKLTKWQLLLYGTIKDPIRLRLPPRTPLPFPVPQAQIQPFFEVPLYSHYKNSPSFYNAQGSEMKLSIVPLNDKSDNNSDNDNDNNNVNYVSDNNVDSPLAKAGGTLDLLCHSECDSQGCLGPGATHCKSCKHFRLDNTCVRECPPRSFPNQKGLCWPCHESCETCIGSGPDNCLTCAPARLRVLDLGLCLQLCPDGYYENFDDGICVPCHANCATCIDRPERCMGCEHNLVMFEGKCYAACPKQAYESADLNCYPCDSTCETCNGSSESQCITCKPGKFSFNGKCLNSCPDGYFPDKKRKECLPCPVGCATCSGFLCLSCEEEWIYDDGKCYPSKSGKCDSKEYYDGAHCRRCHSTCETCITGGDQGCLSCSSSYFLQKGKCLPDCNDGYYMEQGQCIPCMHTCETCVSRLNCTKCAKDLELQSGECRGTCADGYYSDLGVCSKCYIACKTCSGPGKNKCVTCPPGWELVGGECHAECPEGFFKADYGCQKCHHFCRTCKGEGPLACTSCNPGSMLDGGLCMECLGGQYYDISSELCKSCHKSCHKCTGPGESSCVACLPPLHLDRHLNQCLPCCSELKQLNCCHCDNERGECENPSLAGKRRISESASKKKPSSTTVADHSGLNTVTVVVITVCVTVIVLFAIIFSVLQVRSNPCWNKSRSSGYVKVPLINLGARTGCVENVNLSEDQTRNIDSEEEHFFIAT